MGDLIKQHIFSLSRKEPKTGKMYTVPIRYSGTSKRDALDNFLADHSEKEVASFIEPILWVYNDYDSYRTTLFLVGEKKKVKFSAERQRKGKSGRYLPGESDIDWIEARRILAEHVAKRMLEWIRESVSEG